MVKEAVVRTGVSSLRGVDRIVYYFNHCDYCNSINICCWYLVLALWRLCQLTLEVTNGKGKYWELLWMVKKIMEQDIHVCRMCTLPLLCYPLPCRPISISTHRFPTNKVVHVSQVFFRAPGPYQAHPLPLHTNTSLSFCYHYLTFSQPGRHLSDI